MGRKQKLTQSPVKQAAVKLGVKVLQPKKLGGSPELAEAIALAPDLIITAAYGQFLPTKFLNAAKITAVNVHGSLLPKYRGGAPIQYSIINGDKETGVTLIQMVKKMDAGGMWAQTAIPLTRADDTGTVFDKLSLVGRDLLMKKNCRPSLPVNSRFRKTKRKSRSRRPSARTRSTWISL